MTINHHQSDSIEFSSGSWPLAPDKPTLVFIHGAAQSRAFWDLQIKGLGKRFNTIAPDLPGHGGSPAPGRNKIKDYTREIMAFIQRINAPRPIPCGLSMGGGIVLQLVIDYPQQFDGAVLLNTGARLRVHPSIIETVKKDIRQYTASLKEFAVTDKNRSCRAITRLIEASSQCSPETALMDFKACNDFDAMDHLGKIKTPVLILTAREDRLTPEKYGRFLHEKIAGSRLASLDHCSHFSPIEKPHEVNRAISDFMNRLSHGNML